MKKISENISNKLSKIKLLVMDVDGTLTDGSVYYSSEGLVLKKFSVYDGMGISLLKQSNILTMFLSNDSSQIPMKRAEKLNIDFVFVGVKRKSITLTEFLDCQNIISEKVGYIGDDINDLEAIELCGFSACPHNAMQIVKDKVDYVSEYSGGEGAVRQICEMILIAQDKPITLIW